MTYSIKKFLICFIALLSLVIFSSNGIADDAKVFPGAICQKKQKTAHRLIYGGASVVNIEREVAAQDRSAHVFCPLVRDQTTKRWISISVRVTDNSTREAVRCIATNYDTNGHESESIHRNSGKSFVGSTTLIFPRPPASQDGLGMPFSVFCTLPANTDVKNCGPASALRCGFTAIHNIRLNEE